MTDMPQPLLPEITEIRADGSLKPASRNWIVEEPVALEFNGLSYAVMMATPEDLSDFAIGFAITEGLARSAADLSAIDIAETENGWIVRAQLGGLGIEHLQERVRTRISESSCGLCGIENLDALAAPLPPVREHEAISATTIFHALSLLPAHQQLGRVTGAAHGAAFCAREGSILYMREDVGRHNALDKLIGALSFANRAADTGFILSTARCSYEIVEKAVRAGATTLVTISLPTSMAVSRAHQAGLSLWCLARDDSVLHVLNGSDPMTG
ncbi:MAG: formate dehydrogenase accessory sulfurtransferase FdhD [Sphingomonadaceae bacterium]